jgi:cytochrome c556
MQAPIVPASDAVFGAVVYTNGQLARAPSGDAEWDRLGQHATALLDAALRLRTMAPKGSDPSIWVHQSDALAEASQAAVDAVSARSLDGVLDAGSRIYDACTRCHAKYTSPD